MIKIEPVSFCLGFVLAVFACFVFIKLIGFFFFNPKKTNLMSKDNAEIVLKKHEISHGAYFPTAGIDNNELREAIDSIYYSNHDIATIFIDKNNRIIGFIGAKPIDKPRISLVIDNTEQKS